MPETLVLEDSVDVGQTLNGYVVTRPIGRGAHGVVFEAHKSSDPGRKLALKVIEDSQRLDSVLLEPELLSKLQHPNIVHLEDYFLLGGKVVLVMELLEGGELQGELEKRGRFSPAEVADVLLQVADGLAYAHQQGIVHGDIKLSNILSGSAGDAPRFVLVDFGVSRMAEGFQIKKSIRGTYHFMAPEQLRGRPSKESDLWALGATAYTLLAGRKPFEGEDLATLAKEIFFSTPKAPSEVTGVPAPDLERIIYRLLEKDPMNRFASAEELRQEMLAINSASVRTPPKEIGGFAPAVERIVSGESTREVEARREIRRSWRWFWVLIALSSIPQLIVGSAITWAGLGLFLTAQENERTAKARALAGLSLIVVGFASTAIIFGLLATLFGLDPDIAGFLAGLLMTLFGLSAAHFAVKARKQEREVFLLQAVRLGGIEQDRLIKIVGDFLDTHGGDLSLHERYVEALLAMKRPKEAIVEAKLLLEVDPYNFAGSLLLAYGYFEVRLFRECLAVCDGYLALAGQCFEFSDLSARARVSIGKGQ